ncbi:MAG: SprT family zinc-dependent metalloprotease [Gammaproteobacteria bacterium]|nr:SprT family zinc-dependent metalloprotease [Gammaproteobacteria bacterium]
MDNSIVTLAWPPAFTLKKSPRARHVKLKASVRNGLELVVPMRFNQKNIPEILETNKSWILKHLNQIQSQRQSTDSHTLPTEIALLAANQIWKIDYIKTDNAKLRLFKRPNQELALLGKTDNKETVKKILGAWAKNQARVILTKRLDELSALTNLPYSRVSIRSQRSRWGSCSSDKAISLNYKLLFLPAHLLDHIIIHELCHTVHMNHSGKFWRLVASFDSAWKENSRDIKHAEKYMPVWLEI